MLLRHQFLFFVLLACALNLNASARRSLHPAECTYTIPALLAPVDGATNVASPVTFSWSASTGAEGYGLHILVNGALFADLTTAGTALAVVLPSGVISWSVDAHGAACATGTSPVASFTVPAATACPTEGPHLTAPVDAATVTSAVAFSWTGVTGATYHLFIFKDGDLFYDSILDLASMTVELPPGSFSWAVEAVVPGCSALDSEFRTFSIPSPFICPTSGPTRISPADGATSVSSPVRFSWSAVNGAQSYRLIVVDSVTSLLVDVEETTDTSFDLTLGPGAYSWIAEAVISGCDAVDSSLGSFTVPLSADCPQTAPLLTAPAEGAQLTSTSTTFTWDGVAGAIGYELYLEPADGFPTLLASTGPAETSFAAESLPAGDGIWFVDALFNGCFNTESAARTLTVPGNICNHDVPFAFAPPDGTDDATSPVTFDWTAVAGATSYTVLGSVNGGAFKPLAPATGGTELTVPLSPGVIDWIVQPSFSDCPGEASGSSRVQVVPSPLPCTDPQQPEAFTFGAASSGETYSVFWTSVPNSHVYELQESSTEDFMSADTKTVNDLSADFVHTVTVQSSFFYRVRAINDCTQKRGPYSPEVSIVIDAPAAATEDSFAHTTQLGDSASITQTVFIPGTNSKVDTRGASASRGRRRAISRGNSGATFSATTDQPWLTVTPSSGTVPPQGTTVTVTANPLLLPVGTTTGTVQLTTGAASPSNLPVSISLVTPVMPTPGNAPPPDALILPVVMHSDAPSSPVRSNVEISNLSAKTVRVQMNFTPSNVNGASVGKQAVIQIDPGTTAALDDVLKNWFGISSTSTTIGTLEVRALNSGGGSNGSPSIITSAVTLQGGAGTTGGFVGAIPFNRFAGRTKDPAKPTTLLLQGLAQNTTWATSLGLVEGAGQPATVLISLFDPANHKIDEFSVALQAGEQKEISLASRNLSAPEARAEVNVTSEGGRVTTYARVTDARSGDSSTLLPSRLSDAAPGHTWMLGAAALPEAGGERQTDLRLFNGGATTATVTIRFYPSGPSGAPASTTLTLTPGQTKVLSQVVATTMARNGTTGSLEIESTGTVIAGGRIYLDGSAGTFGDPVSLLAASDAIGTSDRPRQILHAVQSDRYSTRIALAEVSGRAATVEVGAVIPGALSAPNLTIQLQPNEYREIDAVLSRMNLQNAYNARLTVKVVSGSGKVLASGTVVDQTSHDQTVVPAE